MQVTVLAGGIGAARFLRGLVSATGSTHHQPSVTVIGNTGDDIRLFGLQICPDLDSVMYTLGGGADEERGWGRANESFTVLEELRRYGANRIGSASATEISPPIWSAPRHLTLAIGCRR